MNRAMNLAVEGVEKLTPEEKIKQVLTKMNGRVPWQIKRGKKIRDRERSGRISS